MALESDWNYKSISQFHDRVRALLDNLSEQSLPDKFIDMPEKAPFAEAYAKSKVQNWENLNDEELKIFESAIIYKTASMFESLVNSNSVKRKELPTITLEYFAKSDIQINGLSLSRLADMLLSKISGDEGIDFVGFMVTQ